MLGLCRDVFIGVGLSIGLSPARKVSAAGLRWRSGLGAGLRLGLGWIAAAVEHVGYKPTGHMGIVGLG